MSTYQGDTVRIASTAIGLNGTLLLDNTMSLTVTCQVWDTNIPPNEIVTPTNMTWDSTESNWFFDWRTDPVITPGRYVAVVEITGAGIHPFSKREYKTLSVKSDKVIQGSV